MNASDYLKTQAQILIALECIRKEKLEEFIRVSQHLTETGEPLTDFYGHTVNCDPSRLCRLAAAAIQFRNAAAERKPITSTTNPAQQRRQTA
jgi:hypothetical protein